MELSEYKKRKQAGTMRFRRINKDRIVIETEIYDQATGELVDIHQKTVDKTLIQKQITELEAQLEGLQELLDDINEVNRDEST